jgi:hypothetical protein
VALHSCWHSVASPSAPDRGYNRDAGLSSETTSGLTLFDFPWTTTPMADLHSSPSVYCGLLDTVARSEECKCTGFATMIQDTNDEERVRLVTPFMRAAENLLKDRETGSHCLWSQVGCTSTNYALRIDRAGHTQTLWIAIRSPSNNFRLSPFTSASCSHSFFLFWYSKFIVLRGYLCYMLHWMWC